MTSMVNNLYGSYPDFYKRKIVYKSKTVYKSPTLITIPRGASRKTGITHYDCLGSTYTGLHSDGHPSKPTAYTGPTLMAIPRGSPERQGDWPTMTV